MSRIYRTQKEYEQFLIREFLDHLGYRISRPKWQESPDALLTLSKGKNKKRVAIEHTDYFNDTVAGKCSPLTPIDEFWRAVQYSLIRRISHRKHLTGISATVNFKRNPSIPRDYKELAKQLAKELVSFVEVHKVRQSEHLNFYCRDFNGRPTLETMLSRLFIWRETDDEIPAFRSHWLCSNTNAGGIGLNWEYIKSAIENKNEKAANYNNWGRADKKWLLIAASGAILSNHAGPLTQNVNKINVDLINICQNSPFDKIVLWERSKCWYKWLKPDRPAVQYKNP